MITLEEVIKSAIVSDLYRDTSEDTNTAAEYTIDDYGDSLSTTLHTLKALPIDTSTAIKTIEEIFLVLDRQYDKVVEGITDHINLLKLEKIL